MVHFPLPFFYFALLEGYGLKDILTMLFLTDSRYWEHQMLIKLLNFFFKTLHLTLEMFVPMLDVYGIYIYMCV